MHVIVVGCGRVGSGLARSLSAEGHTVAIIDKEERSFRRLPSGFTGTTHIGLGFDRDLLIAAGAERAQSLAAVTSGDNSNILAARIAKETFAIEKVVARIYDPRRAAIFQRLGIATVATVTWTTDQIVQYQPEIECGAAVQLHAATELWAVGNQPPGAARMPAAHRLTMSNRLLTHRFHLLSVTLLESILRDFAVPDNWP